MKTFEIGERVSIKETDHRGSRRIPCTVEAIDGRTLTLRDQRNGELLEYVNAHFVKKDKARAVRPRSSLRGAHQRDLPAVAPAPRTVVRAAPEAVDAIVAKRGPWRSPEYLAFVRALPCCACDAPPPNDPHHYGRRGTGQKTHDVLTVPLCRSCHDQFHRTGRIEPHGPAETKHFLRDEILRVVIRFFQRHTFVPLVFEAPPCAGAAR